MERASERLPMIDILRLFSFFAIVIFHMTYALWGRNGFDFIPDSHLSTRILESYGRLMAFSGFTVLFLSFFLFGFRAIQPDWRKLWLTLFGFFLVWAVAGGEFPYIWDVYPYLLVATLLCALSSKWPAWVLVALGGVTTSLPFWRLESILNLSPLVTGALFGNCSHSGGLGEEWPLLPWLGYPLFALGVGKLAFTHREGLTKMKSAEAVFWVAALSYSTTLLGGYFSTPIGDHFACFMFQRPADIFWAHQVWPIFFLRLGFLASVKASLTNSATTQKISRLMINQRFLFAYFIHYPFCLAWAALAAASAMPPEWAFALGVVTCIIWAEVTPRLFRPPKRLLNQMNRLSGATRSDFELQFRPRRL